MIRAQIRGCTTRPPSQRRILTGWYRCSRHSPPDGQRAPRRPGSGPLTIGEQAEHLGLSAATTSELVAQLEERGIPRVLADDALKRAVHAMRPTDRAALVQGLRALLKAGEETSHSAGIAPTRRAR